MERDQCWSDPDWCSWLELVFACLIDELPTGFRGSSITKFFRTRAGIPSMRKPASREITSASVELCETEVCFLHIQLIGTNVCLPKMHMSPPDVDFESRRSLAKLESWNNPDLHCCAVFHTWHSVWVHMCDEYISTSKFVCSRTMQYQVYQYVPNTGISEKSLSKLLTILQQIPLLLPWIGGRQGMVLRLCITVELFCTPIRNTFHAFICMTFHVIRPRRNTQIFRPM